MRKNGVIDDLEEDDEATDAESYDAESMA